MAKALNVSLAVTADTSLAKAQLLQLQTTLLQLTTNSANLKLGLDATLLKAVTADVDKLALHLKNATNVNTGTLDFAKLSTSILASGSSLNQYGQALLKLGPQGLLAFSQLTQAIAKSEVPMNRLKGLIGEFGTVLSNTIRWQLSSSAIHGFMGAISTAYNYAKDLNLSLNNILIVTQMSDESMSKFAESANKAAKSLSTTTTSYTDAALIYYQLGIRDLDEINKRTSATVKMANVTGLSALQVSNLMTAIWNNFAKGGDNLEYYADVITALGAATASSSEEISRGLEKFAATADTVGLSYENATAALATITATTRLSADSVGTGLRTLFARLDSLKLGETLEDGVDLTKYTKALLSVGVLVLDANGDLKRMDDILDDLGQKWNDISDTQKVALALTVGGVRQYTTLMALMNNFDFYKENIDVAKSSEGTLLTQQETYEKSWLASTKRVRASLESIYTDLLNDRFFIGLNNTFSGFLNLLDSIIDGFGGLKTLLPGLSAILISTFSDKLASNMVKFATSLLMIMPGATTRFLQERSNFLNNAAYSLAGLSTNLNLNEDLQKALSYAQASIRMLETYVRNQSVMTPFERLYALLQMDRYDALRQNYSNAISLRVLSLDKVDNTRASLVARVNDDVIKVLLGTKLQKNGTLANANKLLRELFNTIKNSGGSFSQWFDKDNKFSDKLYWDTFNTGLHNVSKDIEDIEKRKLAIKEFSDSSQLGIENLIKTLEGTGMKDARAAVTAMTSVDKIDEDERKALMDSFSDQQNNIVNNFANQWGLSALAVSQYRSAIVAAVGDLEKLAQIAELIKNSEEQATLAVQKRNLAMETALKITGIATSLTAMASSANSASSAVDNFFSMWKNGADFSGIVGMISSIGTSLLMVGRTATTLLATFTSMSGPVGWLLALIPVIAGLGYGIYKGLKGETDEERLSRLQEEAANAKSIAEEAKTAYDNLLSDVSSHNNLLEELNNLTEGTEAFKDALLEANSIATNLIETYGFLLGKDFNFENGRIVFNLESLTNAMAASALMSNASRGLSFTKLFASDYENGYKNSLDYKRATGTTESFINAIDSEIRSTAFYDTYGSPANLFAKFFNSDEGYKLADEFYKLTNIKELGYEKVLEYLNSDEETIKLLDSFISHSSNELYKSAADYFESVLIPNAIEALGGSHLGIKTYENMLQWITGANADNTTRKENIGKNLFESELRNIANEDNIITEAESMALLAISDSYDSSAIEQERTEIESNIKDTFADLNGLAEYERIYEEEFSKAALQYLQITEDYQKASIEEKLEKLKDYVAGNRVNQWLSKKLNAEVGKFTNNKELLTIYLNLLNLTLSEIMLLNIENQNWTDEEKLYFANLKDKYLLKILDIGKNLLKTVFGEDNKNLIDPEQWQIAAKDWIAGDAIMKKFSGLFLKTVDDNTFLLALGKAILNVDTSTMNTELVSILQGVDTTSDLTALLGLKKLSKSPLAKNVKQLLDGLYDTGFTAIGKEAGLLLLLYGDTDFTKTLQKLLELFKKTGKLAAEDIMKVADSCEILLSYLLDGEQSATALAAAIELMASGGVSSIKDISQAFIVAMSLAGALGDLLASVFNYIDNELFSRSIGDISKRFSDIIKDYFAELGEGNIGGERMYQLAEALFGKNYALRLRDFNYGQDHEINGIDVNPEAKQKAYDKLFKKYDDVLLLVQKEGNLRPYWDAMLNAKGIGGELMSSVPNLTVALALATIGFSNKGKNGDIELDVGTRTTEDMTEAIAKALNITSDEAAIRLQEFVGHSGSAGISLKENDARAALNAIVNNGGWDSMSWMEQATFLDKYGDILDRVTGLTNELQEALKQLNETLIKLNKSREQVANDYLSNNNMADSFLNNAEVYSRNENNLNEIIAKGQEVGYQAADIIEGLNKEIQSGERNVSDFSYTATNAYGEATNNVLLLKDGLIDLEATQKAAEVAIHDSNIEHDAKILALAFLEAFSGASELEPVKITFDTKDAETQISSLKDAISIDDTEISINVTDNETAAAVQTLIDAINGKTIDIVINPVDNVTSAIDKIISANSSKTITIRTDIGSGTGATGGRVHGAYAAGVQVPDHNLKPGLSLTGEEGPEIVWNKNQGYSYIVGEKHPEFTVLYPGDLVFNAQLTKEILNSVALGGKIYESHADSAYGGRLGPKKPTTKKSGGGSGDSKDDKSKEYKPERYHVVSRQLTVLEKQYERLEKAKENAYGTNILDAIEDEIAALDQVIVKLRELIQEVEKWKAEDLKKLKELGVKYTLDANGEIANWDALQKKYEKAAQTSDDENAKKIWEAILQYEETVDKLRDETDKLQEEIYKLMQLRLEKITLQAELKIKFDDKQIKLLEHQLNHLEDNIYATGEALALMGDLMERIHDQMNSTQQAINGIFSEMTDSKGNKIDLTLDLFLTLSAAEKDALGINGAFGEALEELIDNLLEYVEALEEYKTNGVDRLAKAFDELSDNVDNAMSKFEYFTGILTTLRDIVDLQNIKFSKSLRDSVKQVQSALMNTSTNNIKAYQDYYHSLEQEANAVRLHLAETTDIDLAKKYQELLDELEDKMRDCMSEITDLWQATLTQAKEDFEQQLDWLVEDYEETLSGIYGTLDMYGDAFDRERKVRERYVEDYEKYYQLSKLQRSINKDLDKSALAGYKGNKQLRDLLKEIQDLLASGKDISAYELEVLEKRYEYFKALADLEEARDAKHTVRLLRDRNGNWGYVYTANEDELEDLLQKADDKLHELQEFIRSSQDDLEDQIQELYSSYATLRVDMIKNGASAEALAKFDEYFMGLLNYLLGQWQESLDDAGSTVDTAKDRYKQDSFDIIDLFGETATAALLSTDSMAELFNIINETMADAANDMTLIVNDYSAVVERLNNLIGGEAPFAENLSSFVESINTASDNYLDITKNAVKEFKDSYDEILKAAEAFESKYTTIYEEIIKKNMELIDKMREALDDLNRYLNTNTGPGNKTDNKPSTPSSSSSGSGNGGKSGGSGGTNSKGDSSSNKSSSPKKKKIGTLVDKSWNKNGTHHWHDVTIQYSDGSTEKSVLDKAAHKGLAKREGNYKNTYCSVCGYRISSIKIEVKSTNVKNTSSALNIPGVTRTRNMLSTYDTGGYTGDWGSNEGRWAILHEKEQVFNKEDTARLLLASKILQTIDIQARYASGAFGNVSSPMVGSNAQVVQQNVQITASFPNAVNHAEIEEAFNNLSNKAVQYANRKNK